MTNSCHSRAFFGAAMLTTMYFYYISVFEKVFTLLNHSKVAQTQLKTQWALSAVSLSITSPYERASSSCGDMNAECWKLGVIVALG